MDHLMSSLGIEVYQPEVTSRVVWRRIYLTEDAKSWLANDLKNVGQSETEGPTPAAQVFAELEQFCEGMPLTLTQDVKPLRPHEQRVWQLKTPDVRLFGWFVCKDAFVVHSAGDANVLHGEDDVRKRDEDSLYRPYIDEVVRYRASLDSKLAGITGLRISDVLSNRVR
jgi:hypothetical protein